MTALEDLIDGASGDVVPVATLLRKVKVVASRLGSVALEEWVDHELTGYPPDANLPDYRGPFHAEVKGHFGGPAGSGLRNAPVPPLGFPKDFRQGALFNVEFRQPIAELERLAQADAPLSADWPANAVAYTNTLAAQGKVQLYEYMGLHQAWRVISPTQLIGIVDTVRTRILNLALSVEAIEPKAGERDAPAADLGQVHQVVTHVYGGSPNIAVASSHFKQEVTLPIGDRAALFDQLRELGASDDDIRELEAALIEDAAEGEGGPCTGVGPRVTAWTGRMAFKGGSAATKGALAAGGGLIAKAIAAHYGLM